MLKERKYPVSLFLAGFFLNLVKIFYILLIAILLFIIRIFVPIIPVIIPIAMIVLWLLTAFIIQLKYRKVALSRSDNKDFNDFLDKVFDPDGAENWRKTTIDIVNEKIKENNNKE